MTRDQRADGVRRLRALLEPVLDALGVDVDDGRLRSRIVMSQDFHEAAVAGSARIGHHDAERSPETLARLPKSLLLAPGIGAQGATFDDMARNFGTATARALPSVSRGILAKGPDVASLRAAIELNCDLARKARDRATSWSTSPPAGVDDVEPRF